MPGGDRTGPMGMGPQTGRAAGFCAGYDGPGYMNPSFGRGAGFGGGRGGGRGMAFRRGRNFGGGQRGGWGWRSAGPNDVMTEGQPSEQPALQALAERVTQLQAELSDVLERINQLKPTQKSGKGE